MKSSNGWNLSPSRSKRLTDSTLLAEDQLAHFGIDPNSDYGRIVKRIALRLYECRDDLDLLKTTFEGMVELGARERISTFNGKKFLAFQFAKLLHDLGEPARLSYRRLAHRRATQYAKGPFAAFDNVPAIFSATPVITRTATYIYACAEWIADAFEGKEALLEVYSRLLNPTSISLANYIVEVEAGPESNRYLAWNFNSGMAAIDAILSHLVGHRDLIITNLNIYGGTHQLIFDWYRKNPNFDVAVETFVPKSHQPPHGSSMDDSSMDDSSMDNSSMDNSSMVGAVNEGSSAGSEEMSDADDFHIWASSLLKRDDIAMRLAESPDRRVLLFLESPCNPHGYVLDVPGICRNAHALGMTVVLDATVGTPFLFRSLQQPEEEDRPDFVVHSYTKDLSGMGTVIGGVVIGRNETMFVAKERSKEGAEVKTLFWNVYYVKGAFLNADAAFEVIQGMRTLEMRMLAKCINTLILTEFLSAHPRIRVNSNSVSGHANAKYREANLFLKLPAPLFTIDMEAAFFAEDDDEAARQSGEYDFKRFFDSLSPTFDHEISLGQTNTMIACPYYTTHSELTPADREKAGIKRTSIRFAMGDENPMDLIDHFKASAELALGPAFLEGFPSKEECKAIIRKHYTQTHTAYIEASFAEP